MRRLPLSRAIVVLGIMLPTRALAEERVSITWSAPSECPSSQELATRARERMSGGAAVRASGRVSRAGGRYALILEVESASLKGERALDAASCDELATSAAIVIAMSVAPPREEPREGPAPAPDPSTPAAPAAPPKEPTADGARADRDAQTERAPTGPRETSFLLRPEVTLDVGTLPSLAAGGGAALGFARGRLLVEVHGQAYASQDGHADRDASKGGTFAAVAGGARGCWSFTRGVALGPCIGVNLGRVSATGFGAAKTGDGASWLVGPEAGIAAYVHAAGPVGVRVGASALVPISRQSFVITATGAVHEPAAVALRGHAGAEVRF